MERKIVVSNPDAKRLLAEGVNILAEAVGSTLGPKGSNVVIETPYGPTTVTKDGVTVAKHINVDNPVQNMGIDIVKQAASSTATIAGDGPQPLTSKVLAHNGFVQMGDLKVGDVICGTDGTHQIVEGVYPKGDKQVYEVHFSDGRIVECCEDHLWTVTTSYGNTKTMPLKDIISSNKVVSTSSKGDKTYGFYTPKTVVEFTGAPTSIDPYLLGLLLGDGSLSGTGEIELSLGIRKEYILENIPKELVTTINFVEEKNYFRVKFKDALLKEQLTQLGLYGTNSFTKFIPKSYLYNVKEIREQLLQGLLDTDAHINNKGLFEFSTVSDILARDFLQLTRSLGLVTHHYVRDRSNDLGAYSSTPVHRISQLKGYKHGIKIIDIVPTNRIVPMQCIKVSNPDNLYITDNFIVTHNTTTSTVLAAALINNGMKLKLSPIDIKRGYERCLEETIEHLDKLSKPVKTSDIQRIATISANNDPELGMLIAEAFSHASASGLITVEESTTPSTHISKVEGSLLDAGFMSPYFITDTKRGVAELENPLILVTDQKIRDTQQIAPVMEIALQASRPLLIIADEIEAIGLQVMVVNKLHGRLTSVAVKAPAFGDRRAEILQDLAALTGATLISDAKAMRMKDITLQDLGSALKVIISKDETVIMEPSGNKEDIQARIDQINLMLQKHKDGYNHEKLIERLARLEGKVAVIKVGASTETEMKEKKDRIDDALRATRAAAESGYLTGGGIPLLDISKQFNHLLSTSVEVAFSDSLQSPIRKIASNAGADPDEVVNSYFKKGLQYNALTNEYVESLSDEGVIDPTMVTKQALINAVSAANMVLLSSTAVYNSDRKAPYNPGSLDDYAN